MERRIKIIYEDGFIYTDMVDLKDDEPSIEHYLIDALIQEANMAYVSYLKMVEDFDSLNKADELIKEVWVDDKRIF